jgi:aminoglycoside phosphotransferase family enzyme
MSIPPFNWGKKNSCHSNVMLSHVVLWNNKMSLLLCLNTITILPLY